ncbi:MAG TPA: UbiA family prenyltransferase [Nevskia sp.]|nr:UbiA family prenyltransferase [Nevskia sp.]
MNGDAAGTAAPPLCVDLDGTLIRGDSMVEACLALLKQQPLQALLLPLWLLRGRAALKREVARRVQLDPASLPYDQAFLEWLRQQQAQGRRLVLCTGSDQSIASAVSAHLGFFEAAIGSDGERNMTGGGKRERLSADYGARGYDYAGNHRVDLKVWSQARRAVVVNGASGLARRAAEHAEVERVFEREGAGLRPWLRALRPHQWAKNALLFVPILAAHAWWDLGALRATALGFVAFCLCASGTYLLNDLLDLEADRAHPRKRLRPFASGVLHPGAGLAVSAALALAAFGLAYATAPLLCALLAFYAVLSLSYSFRIKRLVMLDVITLAALYTLRIIAGAAAARVEASFWLLAFSMFLFLSLAMVKRCAELHALIAEQRSQTKGRGYHAEDLPVLQQLGGASGYLSVLVLALYINSSTSQQLYLHPQVLWLLCPLLLYWVSRVWIITHRGGMHDDPVVFALRDRTSRWLGLLAAVIVALAVK